jgi:hypothetical protein
MVLEHFSVIGADPGPPAVTETLPLPTYCATLGAKAVVGALGSRLAG